MRVVLPSKYMIVRNFDVEITKRRKTVRKFDVEITKRRTITSTKNQNYEKPKLRKIEVCKKTHRQWTVGQMEKNTLFFLSLFCKGDNESTYISFGSTATVQTVLLKNANRYLVVLSFSSPKKESTS